MAQFCTSQSMHNYISTHLRIYVSTLDLRRAQVEMHSSALMSTYVEISMPLGAVPDSASSLDAHARSSPSIIESGARLQAPNGNQKGKKEATIRIRMNASGCLE